MSKKRETLLPDNDTIDLSDIAEFYQSPTGADYDTLAARKASEDAGFTSREPSTPIQKRKRRRRSPYTEQANFKVRLGFKDLFQSAADELELTDAETLEKAFQALLEKEQMTEQSKLFKKLLKDNR